MFGKKKKKTLIEKLTGAIHLDEEDDFDMDDEIEQRHSTQSHARNQIHHSGYAQQQYPQHSEIQSKHMHFGHSNQHTEFEDDVTEDVGELSLDVINSSDAIIIKAMIAGVKPSDVDVDITRDSLTLKATRHDEHEIEDENFHMRELYWGTFARTIALPEEVDVDLAEAKEKHGLLIITLPKLDKHRKAKLQIKSN